MWHGRRRTFSLIACTVFAGLISDEVTKSAQAHTVSAVDLLSLQEIGGYFGGTLSVSPDGHFIAFQIQQADFDARTYAVNWLVASVSGNDKPRHVADGGELILHPYPHGRISGIRAEIKAQWSPDGQWIAYLRQKGGEVQLWRARTDGSLQKQLTRNSADVVAFKWKPNGREIYFEVGRDRKEMQRLDREEADRGYLLDDRFLPYYSQRPLWFACGDDTSGVPQPISQRCMPTLWVLELGGGERRASVSEKREYEALITPARPAGIGAERSIRDVVWNEKRDRAAWFENENPLVNPGYGAPLTLFAGGRRCDAPQCQGQLRSLWWHDDEVIVLKEEGPADAIPALYAWQPERGSVRLIYRLDSTLTFCELVPTTAICLQETPTAPRKIIAIRLDNGASKTVFEPNPEFRHFKLGAVERLEWQDGFGNDAFGHLVYPPDYQRGRRYPLVIVQYRSRGFLKGGVGEEYPIYPLAAQGFLVLSYDRPEDLKLAARCRFDSLEESGACEAVEWKNGYKFRRKLKALEIVLDQLERRGLVDPRKVGITGLSDGAETVDFALYNSQRFAAAAHSGHWSPDIYRLTVNESTRAFMRRFLEAGSGPDAIEAWKPLAVVHNVAKVHTPLLMQLSDTELIMNVPEYVALKDAGKPVEAYVFPGEYHVKWQPRHKLAVAERTIDWFRFWLKGEEDTDGAKVEQYKRWEALRSKLAP